MKIDEFISRYSDSFLIAGKAFSVLLVLLWGAFFIEHLSWFTTGRGIPPLSVILSVILHGILLTGYIIFLFNCRYGSYVILVSAALFFFTILPIYKAFYFFLMSIVPAIIWALAYFGGKCAWRNQNSGDSQDHLRSIG